MTDVRMMRLEDIAVDRGGRMRSPRDVGEIADSLEGRGQLQPVVVDQHGTLVCGWHRYEAARRLGWPEIEVVVREFASSDHRRLAEIDENLIRYDLTALERIEHVAERYRILERLGLVKKSGRPKKALESSGFSVAEIGASLGIGGSTVRWYRSLDERLSVDAKDCIRGSRMEDNLSEIERIAKLGDWDRLAVLYSLEKEKAAGKQIISGGVREMQRRMRRAETKRLGLVAGGVQEGPYRTIVIDPPWSPEIGGDVEGPNGKIAPPYETWPLSRIAKLPINAWEMDGDTHLYLWCTNTTLPHALTLLEGWGYAYHQPLLWIKDRPTSWRYYQNRNEICLFATKGSRLLARADEPNLIYGSRSEHSSKPEAFYEKVERCSASPRLELFARKRRDGWAVWGAEVPPAGLAGQLADKEAEDVIEASSGEGTVGRIGRVVAAAVPWIILAEESGIHYTWLHSWLSLL